jgi:hypothetical protein
MGLDNGYWVSLRSLGFFLGFRKHDIFQYRFFASKELKIGI